MFVKMKLWKTTDVYVYVFTYVSCSAHTASKQLSVTNTNNTLCVQGMYMPTYVLSTWYFVTVT